MHNSVTS